MPRAAGICHVILAVTDDGTPSLTSYRRVIFKVKAPSNRISPFRGQNDSNGLKASRLPLCAFASGVLCLTFVTSPERASAESGYDLWLRYRTSDASNRSVDKGSLTALFVSGTSPGSEVVRLELARGLRGLLGAEIPVSDAVRADGTLVVASRASSPALVAELGLVPALAGLGREGYLIRAVRVGAHVATVIASESDAGALYGAFHFLRLIQTGEPIGELDIAQRPRIERRLLNHWDNLDGTIERGYAGGSLWNWAELPDRVDPRVLDYARANASIGINGTVVNSVNARPESLRADYLAKTAALARAFRPYGLRVYLSANFAAPKLLGGLPTADPQDTRVARWWREKADEIYRLIPDFGGFLVKANSEGQPGPQDYGRSHADGANVLADAVAPHGGVVMWRAFVYNADVDPDRIKRAYLEFLPLDDKFRKNVFVQVKNGPLDFQPREPFHPLFGATKHTPLMAELQITQEYLGQSTHLVYLAPMWKEFLDADTYSAGAGSLVESRGRHAHRGEPDRHRRRRQQRARSELVRPRLRPGQLVRLRTPGLGPRPRRGHDRGRVDPHDLEPEAGSRGARSAR